MMLSERIALWNDGSFQMDDTVRNQKRAETEYSVKVEAQRSREQERLRRQQEALRLRHLYARREAVRSIDRWQ